MPYWIFHFFSLHFVSIGFVSFCLISFRVFFRYNSFRYISFRFFTFRFVSFRSVSFRFVSISFRTLQVPYFISYKHNFIEQKRKYVIFLDIGGILEKGVHESSVCDTGVYRFPNFHIFKQFPFQFPYNFGPFFSILNYI